ncbi:MAG: sigma-54 dependent transcriptional regulator [Acidobacteriota bacterium]
MRIFLAEDRASLRHVLAESFERENFSVVQAADGRQAMERVEEGGYDLAVFDLKMPVYSGLELLGASRARWPTVPVIVLTAYGSVETAVEAMKNGAYDFISKPVDMDHLLILVRRALEADRLERVEAALRDDLARLPAFQSIVGVSGPLRRAQEEAGRVANTDAAVLLLGETGVGKELFARAIHQASTRMGSAFVAVNCAAIPAGLLENELFGHEKGAFTGAHEARMGKFELAHRGTLFLDEIGEMHPDLQAKLLRVLEDGTFLRIGGLRPVRVDVRMICATNRNLEEMVKTGDFRPDLFYRISSFPIQIPPLRDRPEDIPELTDHILVNLRRELGKPNLAIEPDALSWLRSQPWPGNVRELMNRLERGAILASEDGRIALDDLKGRAVLPSNEALPQALFTETDPERWSQVEESWRIREVLRRCGGDSRRAARVLGLPVEKVKAGAGDMEP